MDILRAYKTKLRPTKVQARYFFGCVGAARYAWNWALARTNEVWLETEKRPSARNVLKKEFNAIKDELCPWIREYPYVAVEKSFISLDDAFTHYWRQKKDGTVANRVEAMKARGKWNRHAAKRLEKGWQGIMLDPGYPTFKSRFDRQSFSLHGSIRLSEDGRLIKLPRIGWLRLAEVGYIPQGVPIKSVTLSERAGDWYISALVEEPLEEKRPYNPHLSLGIDLGVKAAAVFSNGRFQEVDEQILKLRDKLRKLQKKLSRQEIKSSNWYKTKAKINKVHEQITNRMVHLRHEISSYAAHQVSPGRVVVEDLNVQGMTASVKPKQDENGRYLPNNRKQKAGLNRNVLNVGFHEIRRQVKYKADWAGIEVVEADRYYASSKTCSGCGAVDRDLKLSDREYRCEACGLVIDRDLNAAKNLAAYGSKENL